MKTGRIGLMLMLGMGFTLATLTSCNNSQKQKKEETPAVGSDKDEHGCLPSAGYTWSEVQKDCIRLWEKGVRTEAVTDKEDVAYIVFAPDSVKVELFFSADRPNEILERRSLPDGTHAWNQEDDDTKNVRLQDGKWTISQRGKLIYQQVEKAE